LETALSYLINFFVVAGIFLLIASLFPIQRLIRQLPEKASLKVKWQTLNGLIVFFIVGYIAYTVAHWQKEISSADLVVPILFFSGAVFVLLVGRLAYQTASDIKKMAHLECENITDPLMGIHNRRYLEIRLKNLIAEMDRYEESLSCIMADIDHFKKINDTYGHDCGDMVLKKVASILEEKARSYDMVSRWGGEEFIIVCARSNRLESFQLAHRLRQAVEKYEFHFTEKIKGRVTISIGIATWSPDFVNEDELIKEADNCLYLAKKHGRNRVIAIPPPSD